MTDPEACRFYGVGFVLPQVRDNKLRASLLNIIIMKRLESFSLMGADSLGFRLTIIRRGVPRAFP